MVLGVVCDRAFGRWHGARSNAIVLSVGFAAASSVSSAFILRKASQLCR
jgi:hypothetical protein